METDGEIVGKVLRGDPIAWTNMFSAHAPMVAAIVRTNRAMGSYRRSEDDVRNVMALVFERLRRDDFRALRTFETWREKNVGKRFEDWLTIVTVNVLRNYISAKLGVPRDDGASAKQLVNTLAERLRGGDDEPLMRPHMTTQQTAARIIEYARDHLAEDQLAVLAGWLEGATLEELMIDLRMPDVRTAERLLRSALARLRRRFASDRG